MSMDTVKLRNGAVESAAYVAVTRATLDSLATTEPVTLYELLACAQDRNHKPWGNTGDTLKRLKLISVAPSGSGAGREPGLRRTFLTCMK